MFTAIEDLSRTVNTFHTPYHTKYKLSNMVYRVYTILVDWLSRE